VRATFETAIILDKKQISAYSYLASVFILLNKFEDALKYAKQGISIIKEIRKLNAPFILSDIEEIKHAGQNMDNIEKALKQLAEDCEQQLV
jgi:hypothetical protein